MINFEQFKNQTWIKHWAGHFSVVYNTMLGTHNTTELKKTFGVGLGQALYLYKQGYTFAYFNETEYKKFGTVLAEKIVVDETLVETWCINFRKVTDELRFYIANNKGKQLSATEFTFYTNLFFNYSTWHRAVKMVVDFLPDILREKYFHLFEVARVHAEPAYSDTEHFVQELSKTIAAKTSYTYENLLTLTTVEMHNYLEHSTLPEEAILQQRSLGYAITFKDGHFRNLKGQDFQTLEKVITQKIGGAIIKGKTAYPGVVTARVSVVFDPFNAPHFRDGDVLVTGMTRPEFLPLMKRASAFVTDAGGMLSHAAITARELKKPCVVGTEVGSKILKDGDVVTVDATNGTIKKSLA